MSSPPGPVRSTDNPAAVGVLRLFAGSVARLLLRFFPTLTVTSVLSYSHQNRILSAVTAERQLFPYISRLYRDFHKSLHSPVQSESRLGETVIEEFSIVNSAPKCVTC